MKPTETNRIVIDLLNVLIGENRDYKWKLKCSYSDGKGKTIMEASIYSGENQHRHGRIAYVAETGNVLNFTYRGYQDRKPESVIDLMLDINNLEKHYKQSA